VSTLCRELLSGSTGVGSALQLKRNRGRLRRNKPENAQFGIVAHRELRGAAVENAQSRPSITAERARKRRQV
jgi:hypothetical protein